MKRNKSLNKQKNSKCNNVFFETINKECAEKIDECVNECISEFKFDEAAKIFSIMHYAYAGDVGDFIPNKNDLKNRCINLMYECFARMIISRSDNYSIETGRMKVSTYIINDENEQEHFTARIEFIPVSFDNNYY